MIKGLKQEIEYPEPSGALSMRSIVVAAEEQISSDLAGEAVILSLKSGMYYGLNAVGGRIWSLIQKPMAVSEIREVLLEEYNIGPERCEQDLLGLLKELAANGLIVFKNEESA